MLFYEVYRIKTSPEKGSKSRRDGIQEAGKEESEEVYRITDPD